MEHGDEINEGVVQRRERSTTHCARRDGGGQRVLSLTCLEPWSTPQHVPLDAAACQLASQSVSGRKSEAPKKKNRTNETQRQDGRDRHNTRTRHKTDWSCSLRFGRSEPAGASAGAICRRRRHLRYAGGTFERYLRPGWIERWCR